MKVGERFDEPDDDILPPAPSEGEITALDEPLARPMAAFSNEEIMEELMLRFPAFIFCADRVQADDFSHTYKWTHGRFAELVGLCEILREMMRAYIWRQIFYVE